jgi:hypothetical protein
MSAGSALRGIARGLLCGFLAGGAGGAGAEPHGFGDIRLGSTFEALERELDFRDIESALRAVQAQKLVRPDLGRRGYGCMRRDDPAADITCVSHDEKIGAGETREIRLQFLDGILQQFSITAELARLDAVVQAISGRDGPPQTVVADGATEYRWAQPDSRITGYRGKDLVFVVFELAGYPAAVERKRSGGRPLLECR